MKFKIPQIFNQFSKDIGIDLGTANTLVWYGDKGVIVNEPSIVAINNRSSEIIAIGDEAKKMLGKTPEHIDVVRPLTSGVISDFEVAESMIRYFVDKVIGGSSQFFLRPRMVIGVPLGITEVEKKAVEDAAIRAGAREVFLIEEPLAAALGAKFPVQDSNGYLVVEVGGGTCEIAVLSMGGVVTYRSLKTAGDEFNRNIVQFAREEYGMLLGEKSAESIKIYAASVAPRPEPLEAKMRGRDLLSGLPKEVTINSQDLERALQKSVNFIIDNIKGVLETTPPELVSDIMQAGIYLSGGGAMLRGLDEAIMQETKVPTYVVDDPLTSVARGIGAVLLDLDKLKPVLLAQ